MGCGPEKWGRQRERGGGLWEGTLIEMSPFWNKYGNESRKGRGDKMSLFLPEKESFIFQVRKSEEALSRLRHMRPGVQEVPSVPFLLQKQNICLMSNLS